MHVVSHRVLLICHVKSRWKRSWCERQINEKICCFKVCKLSVASGTMTLIPTKYPIDAGVIMSSTLVPKPKLFSQLEQKNFQIINGGKSIIFFSSFFLRCIFLWGKMCWNKYFLRPSLSPLWWKRRGVWKDFSWSLSHCNNNIVLSYYQMKSSRLRNLMNLFSFPSFITSKVI